MSLMGPSERRGRPPIENVWERRWWKDLRRVTLLKNDDGDEIKHALVRPWQEEDQEDCWVWPSDKNENKEIRRAGRPPIRRLRFHLYELFREVRVDGWEYTLVTADGCQDGCINPFHVVKMTVAEKLATDHAKARAYHKNMEGPIADRRFTLTDGRVLLAKQWAADVYFFLLNSEELLFTWDYTNDLMRWSSTINKPSEPEVVELVRNLAEEYADPTEAAREGMSQVRRGDMKCANLVLELFAICRERRRGPSDEEIHTLRQTMRA